jgi:hypothetical protein
MLTFEYFCQKQGHSDETLIGFPLSQAWQKGTQSY